VSDLPSTKDAALDFVVEAGPRAFTDDLPKILRLEIAKSSALGAYREACKRIAQAEIEEIHRQIAIVSKENRILEKTAHHTRSHTPAYRIPVMMWLKMEDIYGVGCWRDNDFIEDTLKHHPGLRINVKYGTRGQELLKR